jgi:hypothetical protein
MVLLGTGQLGGGGAAPVLQKELPVHVAFQQKTYWCWAAVTAGVALYFGDAKWSAQCDVAKATLGIPTCCAPSPACDRCDVRSTLSSSLTTVGHLDRYLKRGAAFSEIKATIDGDKPLGVRILWANGSGGHFVLVTGYEVDPGDPTLNTIDIRDPFTGYRPDFLFNDFAAGYDSGGQWTHCYWTF